MYLCRQGNTRPQECRSFHSPAQRTLPWSRRRFLPDTDTASRGPCGTLPPLRTPSHCGHTWERLRRRRRKKRIRQMPSTLKWTPCGDDNALHTAVYEWGHCALSGVHHIWQGLTPELSARDYMTGKGAFHYKCQPQSVQEYPNCIQSITNALPSIHFLLLMEMFIRAKWCFSRHWWLRLSLCGGMAFIRQ